MSEGTMKITKSQLRRIIREERSKLQEQWEVSYTPEEEAVVDAISNLEIALSDLPEGNPDLTDYYVSLLRAMKKYAGVDPASLARLA